MSNVLALALQALSQAKKSYDALKESDEMVDDLFVRFTLLRGALESLQASSSSNSDAFLRSIVVVCNTAQAAVEEYHTDRGIRYYYKRLSGYYLAKFKKIQVRLDRCINDSAWHNGAPKHPSLLSIGQEIALYNSADKDGGFVQMKADGKMEVLQWPPNCALVLEPWRTFERFLIVDGGNGKVCLFNSHHRRFVRLLGEAVNGGAGVRTGPADLPDAGAWPAERFSVVDCGDGSFAFHNEHYNRFVRLVAGSVDAKGGVTSVAELSAERTAERFQVIRHVSPVRPASPVTPAAVPVVVPIVAPAVVSTTPVVPVPGDDKLCRNMCCDVEQLCNQCQCEYQCFRVGAMYSSIKVQYTENRNLRRNTRLIFMLLAAVFAFVPFAVSIATRNSVYEARSNAIRLGNPLPLNLGRDYYLFNDVETGEPGYLAKKKATLILFDGAGGTCSRKLGQCYIVAYPYDYNVRVDDDDCYSCTKTESGWYPLEMPLPLSKRAFTEFKFRKPDGSYGSSPRVCSVTYKNINDIMAFLERATICADWVYGLCITSLCLFRIICLVSCFEDCCCPALKTTRQELTAALKGLILLWQFVLCDMFVLMNVLVLVTPNYGMDVGTIESTCPAELLAATSPDNNISSGATLCLVSLCIYYFFSLLGASNVFKVVQ